MKILFLDDDKERHARFLRNNIGHVIVQAWDYEEACAKLTEHDRFDQAHLDHDLSYEQQTAYVEGLTPPREKTGTDVAEFIAAMPEDKRPRLCVLHSFNDAGWRRMARILTDVGIDCIRRPFSAYDVVPQPRAR